MRNAGLIDMECLEANKYQYITKVMFEVQHPWMGEFKAHIIATTEYAGMKQALLVEDIRGYPFIVAASWLHPIPRKQGTPAKPKKAHQRGTKPWLSKFEYADYDPKIIAPGVRVKCRDKKIRTIEYIRSDRIHFVGCHNLVDTKSGLGNYISKIPFYCDIMKILVEKKIDKHVHERYNGYSPNVWYFWQGLSDKPPVDGDVKVQLWLRENMKPNRFNETAGCFMWKWYSGGNDIIAFKIIPN